MRAADRATGAALGSGAMPRAAVTAMAAPGILLFGYFCVTVLLYFFGPINYHARRPVVLLGFLAAAYLAFAAGYLVPLRRVAAELAKSGITNFRRFEFSVGYRRLLGVTTVIALGLFCFDMVRIFESYPGTLWELVTNPGNGYHFARAVQAAGDRGEGSAFYLATQPPATFSVLLTPAKKIYLALGLVFWRQLGRAVRWAFVVTVGVQLLYAVMMGRQILIGEVLFQLLVFVVYRWAVQNRPITEPRLGAPERILAGWRTSIRRTYLVMIGLLLTMAVVMTVFLASRTRGLSSERIIGSLKMDVTVRHGWLGLDHLPDGVATGVQMISFYLTHGYYGLANALQLPFVWTYGLGSSRALGRYAHQFLGTPDVSQLTYPMRNEINGQSGLDVWSTAFSWLASDFTFPGTILLMLGVGFLLLRVWRQLVIRRNPFAFVMMGQLFLGLFMIVANNQLFHTLENFIITVVIVAGYILSTRFQPSATGDGGQPRIAFITGSLDWGGASKMLKTYANTLARAGHEVEVIVSTKAEATAGLVDSIKVSAPDRVTGLFSRLAVLWRAVPRARADVYLPFVTSMIINSYPFIRNHMKCGFDRGNLLSLPRHHQFFARFIYPRYEHLCFQSEGAWRQLDYLADRRPFIIPNPYLPSGHDPGVFEGRRSKTVVTVSRLSSEKNLDLVIRGFAASRISSDHRLILHGTGPEQGSLAALVAELGLNDQVEFAGASDNVMAEIADAGVFVLASNNEGMPNALLEAMALGIPSVSTNCMPGGTNLLLDDGVNGLVIEKDDVEALTAALDRLHDEPEAAAAMGRNARKVRQDFDLATFERQVHEMMDEISEELRFVG